MEASHYYQKNFVDTTQFLCLTHHGHKAVLRVFQTHKHFVMGVYKEKWKTSDVLNIRLSLLVETGIILQLNLGAFCDQGSGLILR